MAQGGYRPGAGRPPGSKTRLKKKEPEIPKDILQEAEAENMDPLTYMLKVMNSPLADEARRDRMAIAAVSFVHDRAGTGLGKKELKAGKAKAAGVGRFAPVKPPNLKAVK